MRAPRPSISIVTPSLNRAPFLSEALASVRRQPFGIRGLTSDFPAVGDVLAPALAAGDARLEHATLEDILLSFISGSAR